MISRNFKIRKNGRWDKYEVRGYIFIFFIWDELRLFQEDHKISKGELVLLNACNWKFLSILRWHPTTGCFPQDNSSQNWETEVKIHTCPLCVCACVCVLVAQACPTLWDPMGYSLPGSSVHGILQARILKWVAITTFRRSSWPRDWTQVSCIRRQILYRFSHQGSPQSESVSCSFMSSSLCYVYLLYICTYTFV